MTVIKNDENELVPTRLVTCWRVCIDYRKLNEATRKDHFTLPFMDQMLERLAGNEYYCFLDGFSRYFQIPLDPKDQEKTTFTCPYGTFSYKRMPFGLCNAPGTFQRNGSQSTEPVNDNSLIFTTISNLLFDNDKINSDEINSHVKFNSDESTSNHDTVKCDYLDEFYRPFIPIHILEEKRIRREHADYINRMEMLFTINPRPHNSTNVNTNVESFSSFPIPIQESNPHQEEIDVVYVTNDVLPPSDNDSDEEVDAVGDLRVDNFIENSEYEYSESEDSDFDNPPLSLPPPEPPDKEFDFEIDFQKEISVVRSVIVKFECINARVMFDVFNDKNDVLSYFMFVIFAKEFSLLSAESEDTIFDPGFFPQWMKLSYVGYLVGKGVLHPDGFTSTFFKKAWGTVIKDVCKAIKKFLTNRKLLGEVNAIVSSLVPKIPTPDKVTDYRPIAYDLIVMCHGDKRYVEVIKAALDEFSNSSGLLLNPNKSTVFFGSLWNTKKEEILSVIPCSVGALPVLEACSELFSLHFSTQNLDVDINDEDKALLLVISLPASYKHFKEIMLYGNQETLSFDDVKSALSSKQKDDDDVEPESGKGLVARGRSSDRGKSSNKNKKHRSQYCGKYSNKSCKYCKKLGHIVSDCYKLKNKLEREGKGNNEKKPKKDEEVAIAKGDSNGDVYLDIDTEKSRDELIVDSGCTFHMIPHWSWFTTYESFNGGNVYMGNHSICSIIGKGNIQVKMHDGVSHENIQGSFGVDEGHSIRQASMIPRFVIIAWVTWVRKKRVSFSPGIHRIKDALDYIHSDLWGPSPITSRGGNSVDYSNLRVFGCPVYVHVNEGKLVPRAVKCIFLGYGSGVKGYRVWCLDPKYRKIIHSRDVTFNEDVIINSGKDFVPPHNVDNNHTEGKVKFEFDVENSTHTQSPFNDEHIETQDDGNMLTSPQSQPQTEYLLARDHERRQVNRPQRLENYQCYLVSYAFAVAAHIKNCEPTNYLEAISSPECDKWVVAMEDEVESLHKNEMWELMKLPKEKHVISCKWLFKVKDGIPGVESNRYKARFRDGTTRHGSFLYLVLYVDDMLIVAPNKDQIRELKNKLSNEFDMKDLGAAKGILGMEIQRDQKMGKLTLSPTDYISKVLKKFNISSCKPVPTPLAPHFKLSSHECLKSKEDKEDMSRVPYLSAVGSLMYVMVCTRTNLAHAVSVVSRYMHNPSKMHWEAVKCILRYLKGTSNIGLSFEKGRASPNGVVGYVDSDYVGDTDARKSLSSYIYSHCSSAISWYSSLQAITAVSTIEA
uniref:Retrovirus-related Pol polyprotein from transposon TNT 1-94 n=1 Tax=Tanacetum cinerariifolium TaxID=118510 RepID=A0A6L2LMA3_TANCI|nr:retrovirus-related Pol polyprotein from transposon TNT 1-94 [Tanacetum cinerariifolium]